MSELVWRTADVELTEQLIPNPRAEHQLLQRLQNVTVATDGGFLHIDPRQPSDRSQPGQDRYSVHVVPAALVRCVTYKVEATTEPLVAIY